MSEVLLKKILEGAIKIEEESYALYVKAQGIAKLPSSKALLSEFVEAELAQLSHSYLSRFEIAVRKA
jgi:rubrerythrin